MSRIVSTIKNKNIIEKTQRARRKEELKGYKDKASYKASLRDELDRVSALLDISDLNGIVIKIPQKMLPKFSEAIYSEELTEYEVTQIEGKSDEFIIRYRLI